MSAARVLVTGGSGFIGGHLVERLIARGDEVTIFDSGPLPEHQKIARVHARVVEGDIRDPAQLARAVESGVDVIYHLAAVVGVDRYLARPLDVIDINFSGSRNVLDLALRSDAKIIVASTSEVFGKNPAVPWPEDGDRVLGPTSADRWTYGTAKALTEHLTFAYHREHGLDATIVRYFNAYGPGQRPAFMLSRNIHRALNGRTFVAYDQGHQTRCFTYVDDAIDGTLLAAAHPDSAGESFNLGSMVETTVNDVIELIAKLTGAESPTVSVDTLVKLGPQYQDLPRRIPDNAKARRVLGWECATSLPDGLTKTIAWAQENPWWLSLPDTGAL